MHAKPTVLLADDHPGILAKLSQLLAIDFQVVGAVHDGAAAVESVKRLSPDAVVMDISMPVMDGIRAMREIQRMRFNSKVVVLSALDDQACMRHAFESGARGYVVKSRMRADLVIALREVLAGRTFQPRNEAPQCVGTRDD